MTTSTSSLSTPRAHWKSVLWKLALFAFFVAFFWYGCVPQINGRRLNRGDTRARVVRLMGEPEFVFTPKVPLSGGSYLVSYEFHEFGGREDSINLKELPPIRGEALWFPYASAGHLVYFEHGRVTAIYLGGT